MRSHQSVFVLGFLLLIVLSCGVTPSDGRRCTRICEKGRCRPICLRDASTQPEPAAGEIEPLRSPGGP